MLSRCRAGAGGRRKKGGPCGPPSTSIVKELETSAAPTCAGSSRRRRRAALRRLRGLGGRGGRLRRSGRRLDLRRVLLRLGAAAGAPRLEPELQELDALEAVLELEGRRQAAAQLVAQLEQIDSPDARVAPFRASLLEPVLQLLRLGDDPLKLGVRLLEVRQILDERRERPVDQLPARDPLDE